MRLFIFSASIICLMSCHAQDQSMQKQHAIDTLKLFNPTNAQNETIFEIIMARNSMLMHDSLCLVELQSGKSPLMNKKELPKFLSASAAMIRKKLFHILIDSSSSFKEIVEIIDIVKASQIDNYEVFNIYTKPKPPAVLSVSPPTSVSTHTPIDSSWLQIKFHKNIYKISLRKDSLTTSDINMIDKFFANHLDKIDQKKLLVSGGDHDDYSMFRDIKKIFKKYNFPKFMIVTKSYQQDE